MIVYANTTGLTNWTGATTEIDNVVGELARLSKFTQYTRYTAPAGSGAQATLWKRKGKGEKLRLDFQRVFSTAEAKVTRKVVYKFGKKFFDSYEEAKEVAKKKVSEINEVTETKTTYDTDKIWSLFAVQETGSYNQVFVLNNPSFNPTAEEWTGYFSTSLTHHCAAILTTAEGNLPNDFSIHDLIRGMGDLPALTD